jgi:hypothetical protein
MQRFSNIRLEKMKYLPMRVLDELGYPEYREDAGANLSVMISMSIELVVGGLEASEVDEGQIRPCSAIESEHVRMKVPYDVSTYGLHALVQLQ